MTIPAIILAGGKSTRMGGGDKGMRVLAGMPLIERVISRLAPQVKPMAINANGDVRRFAPFGLPVLTDPIADHPGPLAGILAGMDWAASLGADRVLSVAADTPFFPRDLAARLTERSGLVLAASQAPQEPVYLQPTFGLWPVHLRDDLEQSLTRGERKIRSWAQRHDAAQVVFPHSGLDPFFNINTPEDLRQAKAMLRGDQCFRMK